MKMQNMKTILLLLLVFSVSSCLVPDTKETYLRNFERFVKDVEKNNAEFTGTDWKWANKRFSKYSGEWYDKFRDDLRMEDKIQVSLLRSRYLAVKEISKIGRYMNDDLDMHFEKLGDDIKNYMEKDLNKDIDEITRGAREIGDSAVKVMEDVLDQFKKTEKNK